MFTNKQLDKWISEDFDFRDPIYRQAAVEEKAEENVSINFIKIIQPNIVKGNNPQFSLIIHCTTNIENRVEVDIDGKVYQAYLKKEYRKGEIYPTVYHDYYYADLSVTIPMLYVYDFFKLTVKVINQKNKVLRTKAINITASTNGIVQESQFGVPEETGEVDKNLVTYRIYWNNEKTGKIEKLIPKGFDEQTNNQIQYIYHDKDGKEHFIGKFTKKTIKNVYGPVYGGKTVDLVDIRELKNYFSDTIYFRISINTNRYFMNNKTMGSLIGAMCECSYNDFVFNGFSNDKGESIGGSKSHKNGQNGDFRYLRKDQSGKKLYLSLESATGDPCGWKGLDETRQNQFNDALYKFGWKGMLSWKFDNKLLNHCEQKDNDHYDHLHVQSYNPNYKVIML